jgi:penicillin-binding protein 2
MSGMINIPEQPANMGRVRIMIAMVIIGALTLVCRLWYLQIAHGDELFEISMNNQERLIRRLPPRGQITDRDGRVLATNRDEIVVSVIPNEMRKNPDMLQLLASLLGVTPQSISDVVNANKVSSFDPVRVMEDVDMQVATRIEEQKMNLPGVVIGPEPIRYYPDGPLFGHVLGQMGQIQPDELKARRSEGYQPGDYCGKLGIERAYDSDLRGTDGGREIQVDARGRMRKELGNTEPIPGDTLTLNLSKPLQQAAYNGLQTLVSKGYPGAAVALDPNTGAVLALVSVPSYDPNQFVRGISVKNWKKICDNPLLPQIDRAVGSAYAPGSTFKLVTATAGLDTGKINMQDTVFCSGVMYLGKWPKHCHKLSGHGIVDMTSALAKSCDIYFYHLGLKLGPDVMAEYARRFGLGARSGIDLVRPGDIQLERSGTVPTPEWKRSRFHRPWVGGNTVDYAIGQAMLTCTPLQMCNVAATIANGGTLYRPQLVKTITAYDAQGHATVVHRMQPEIIRQIGVPQSVLNDVIEGMKAVMQPGGTGSHIQVPGIPIAGKTGTAQIREHGRLIDNAWFVGFAPVENPKIAICVFVEGGGQGGAVAGPIVKQMMDTYFHISNGSAPSKLSSHR